MDLAFIGVGYCLYFEFIKYCLLILLTFLMTSGGYNLITNIFYGNNCVEDIAI
jgi:hypothetical protein